MTVMTRRALLGATSTLALGALALGACTAAQIQAIAQAVVSDSKLVSSGLQSAFSTIGSVVGIPTATVNEVDADIGNVITAATSVASSLTNAAAETPVQALVSGVNAVVAALTAYSEILPQPMALALQAAQVLLPGIEQAVGLFTSSTASANAGAIDMSVTQARQILAATALKKPA